MARIKNMHKVFAGTPGDIFTIGHNRTVTVGEPVSGGAAYHCALHGHRVVTLEKKRGHVSPDNKRHPGFWIVRLDDCGYHSPTTRQAMNDFLGAFGIVAGVSFAGGKTSVRYTHADGKQRALSTDEGTLVFQAAQ